MVASTTIKCTKSEFLARLTEAFVEPVRGTSEDTMELREVLNGLAVQADQCRGTFSGHSAYLDLDFEVRPDEKIYRACCGTLAIAGVAHEHGCLGPTAVTGEIAIPAVTDAQRAQSRTAAIETVQHVSNRLDTMISTRKLTGELLSAEIHKLMAALGHLTIAEG